MPNRYKKPCDTPSDIELIAISSLVNHGFAYPETLTTRWNSISEARRTVIDTISRAVYPDHDQQEQRQTLTRAMVLQETLVPEDYKWVTPFESAFQLEEQPPETV
jgi:hypothetical protein